MPGGGHTRGRMLKRIQELFGLRRRPVTIRYSLARNLMLMIVVTSGAILAVSYAWGTRVVVARKSIPPAVATLSIARPATRPNSLKSQRAIGLASLTR